MKTLADKLKERLEDISAEAETEMVEPEPVKVRAPHPKALPLDRHRNFRVNLLLDDYEEAAWKALLAELSETVGRKVQGPDVTRSLVIPYLIHFAKRKGLPLPYTEEVPLFDA